MTVGKIKLQREYMILAIISVIISLTTIYSPIFNMVMEDPSVYFSIAQGMKKGLVLYKDITDHKGIYLFFIYYIAALISDNTSIGIWIITLLFSYIHTLFIYKTALVITNDKKCSCVTAIIMCLVYNMQSITYSGYNEHIVLSLFTISIYLYIKYIYIDNGEIHNKYYSITQGILIALIINIKLNYILLYIPLLVDVVVRIIKCKQFKNLGDTIKYGLLGFIIGNIPAWLYCIVNDCMYDMYYRSIIENIIYTQNTDSLYKFLSLVLIFSTPYTFSILLCIVMSFALIKNKDIKKVFFVEVVLQLVVIAMAGRPGYHYAIISFILILPVVIAICKKLNYIKLISVAIVLIVCALNIKELNDRYNEEYKYIEQVSAEFNSDYEEDALYIGFRHGAITLNDIVYDKFINMPCVQYSVNSESIDYKVDKIKSGEYSVVLVQPYWLSKDPGKDAEELIYKTLEECDYIMDKNYNNMFISFIKN